jgi:hypothetical protein
VTLTNCGHIFGRECIQNWIKKGKKECPNCKSKSGMKNILKLFPSSLPLNPIDNSELEQLRKQNTEISKKNTNLERDFRIQSEKLSQTITELKRKEEEIIHLRHNLTLNRQPSTTSGLTSGLTQQTQYSQNISYQYDNNEFKENINIKPISSESINTSHSKYYSRLIVPDKTIDTSVLALPIEQPSNYSSLYPGNKFGIQLIDPRKRRKTKYIPVHKEDIKDISFGCGFLLSGSSDKTMRTVDINASKIVGVYHAPHKVVSVAWNRGKSLIYGGMQNGKLVEFDIRINGKNPTRIFETGKGLPVHSMFYKNNGLLTGQSRLISWTPLDSGPSCNLIESESGHVLPGPMSHFQNQILATFRVHQSPPETVIYKMTSSMTSSNDSTNQRSAKLSESSRFIVGNKHDKIARDKIINYNGAPLAACSNQQAQNTKIFSLSGQLIQTLERNNPGVVLDISSYQIENETFLTELNGKNINFYKF